MVLELLAKKKEKQISLLVSVCTSLSRDWDLGQSEFGSLYFIVCDVLTTENRSLKRDWVEKLHHVGNHLEHLGPKLIHHQ